MDNRNKLNVNLTCPFTPSYFILQARCGIGISRKGFNECRLDCGIQVGTPSTKEQLREIRRLYVLPFLELMFIV